jgi:ATP-dependent helicase/nuclease subunit B
VNRLLVSHDAASRLDAAAAWLAALPADAEVLVLAPTWHAADEIVRLVVAKAGTRFGILRFTPDRLAAQLAAAELARAGRAPCGPLSLVAVAARAAHQLRGEGALPYFEQVGNRPGFPHAVARTLEELRMNGVRPQELERLGRGGPDLARIAARVEQELEQAALADRAAVYAAALRVADAEGIHPLGLPLLLLDLGVETRREADLIVALARRAPGVLAVTAAGDARARERLEVALGAAAEELNGAGDGASLRALQRHLFEESQPPARANDDTVVLRSWPGESRECVEIARAIQTEAARGVPFDAIAILLRSPGEYRPHLEEALRRAEIPVFFARGSSRPDPAGRAFLALLACAAEGLSARRFAEYLSLAQVPEPGAAPEVVTALPDHDLLPSARDALLEEREREPVAAEADPLPDEPEARAVVAGALRAPWRWERVIVDASVIGGHDRWARRLKGLEQELLLQRRELEDAEGARAAQLDRALQDLRHLREFALPMIERLAQLPERASWEAWLERLRALTTAALRAPAGVLAVLAELEPMGPVGPVDLDEVQHVLGPRLGDLMEPADRRRYGAVFVASTDAARGLSFDVVFAPGLAERLFPRKAIEDPMLSDSDREALGAAELATRARRFAAERLALRLAAGAARRRIVLSYPRIDLEQARPRVPSFYALEVLRASEGRLPGFDELQKRAEGDTPAKLGWPAPDDPAAAIDEAEFDLAVLGRLQRGGEEGRGAARYLLGVNPHLTRTLRARAARWRRAWSPADGLVHPDAVAREAMARHQIGARSFSPTALECFAACPYKFFLHAIHRLQPREEPEALEVIDPLTRGSLFHDVQFEVFSRLRDEARLPVTADHLDRAFDLVDGVLDQIAKSYEERLAPAIPRVWKDGIDLIRADLREWLRRGAEAGEGWVPHRFELAFGLADRHRPNADPASVPDPVPVLGGLMLRGAVDLVERHARGTLRVTDHKTGKARAPREVVVGGGTNLQPVLYALACERLLPEPVESGRLYYCTSDGEFTEREVPLNEWSRRQAAEVVKIVGEALAEGFLPAAPDQGACRWCDYRPVCGPHEERRVERKAPEQLGELVRLRGLP